MKSRRWVTVARWAAAIALIFSSQYGCSCRKDPVTQRYEQRYNRVYFASLDTLHATMNRSWDLPGSSYRGFFVNVRPRLVRTLALPFEAHVHPLLLQWLADSSAAKVETLVVTYRDTIPIPSFPQFDDRRPRNDPFNLAVRDSADSLVQRLFRARQPMHDSMATRIVSRGGEVIHSFYLAQIQLVTLPLGSVHWLVDSLGVSYVQPRRGGEAPPSGINLDPLDDPKAARDDMSTEPYVPFSPQYGHAGLIDTGVRSDHDLLKNTGRLLKCWDCRVIPIGPGGVPDPTRRICVETSTWSDPFDHGTASAAILSGGVDRMNRHTGVTEAALNVYQVFSAGTSNGTLDALAAIAAIEHAATVNLDVVILAEMQGLVASMAGGVTLPDFNGITQMADRAYAAKGVIIAPIGDYATYGPAAPAIGRGVMALGAIERSSAGTAIYAGGHGPTADERTKPDVQAFSATETADNTGPQEYAAFTATSGAGPYGAGAAILLRNWLVQASGNQTIDPGQVYAQMILAGQSLPAVNTVSGKIEFGSTVGAGLMVLPTNGYCWFGKADVPPGTPRKIDLNVTGTEAEKMEAALWWEEPTLPNYQSGGIDTHCYLSLTLEDPNGVVTESRVEKGVFQRLTRAAATGTHLPSGHWTLRIKVENSPGYTPKAFWTVAYRR